MAVDHLGNIVWICPVLPGTSADVKIWDTVITGALRALCTRCARAVRKHPPCLWADWTDPMFAAARRSEPVQHPSSCPKVATLLSTMEFEGMAKRIV